MNRIVAICLFLLTTVLTACGGQGTTIVGNTTSSSISIGKMSDEGVSRIAIPIGVFGEEPAASLVSRFLSASSTTSTPSTLAGATIDVKINGVVTNEGIDAEPLYQADDDAVVFNLSSLTAGDRLTFLIHRVDGTTVSFSGEVSDLEAAEAESDSGNTDGSAALEGRDLSTAIDAYCAAFTADDTDSRSAFGCYLSQVLALPETTDADAILDDFGEAHIDVGNDILGNIVDGFVSGETETLQYTAYENLPFISFLSDDGLSTAGKFAQFAVELNLTGTTVAQLQSDIDALYGDFEDMETLLDVALADESFTFEIPAGLFGTTGNLQVSYDQLHLHMGGVKAALVSLDILAAYDFGINASQIVNTDGDDFDYEILVADLNGTGETVNGVTVDTTPFLTLSDSSRITGAITRAEACLSEFSEGLAALEDAQASFIDGSAGNIDSLSAKDSIDTLLASLQNDELTHIGSYMDRDISINLHEFFTNPPSAASVTTTDPFVYEGGTIQMVESYFQDLLDGISAF